MPRSTQALPRASVATAFICQLASGSYSAVGSLESPARWITPSTPSSAVEDLADVGDLELDPAGIGLERTLPQ